MTNWQLLWKLVRAEPWVFMAAVGSMALVQLAMQLAPLVTREFFNLISGSAPVSFGL